MSVDFESLKNGSLNATVTFDQFCAMYAEDDNSWWSTPSGYHQNLFDEALERIAILKEENEHLQRTIQRYRDRWYDRP